MSKVNQINSDLEVVDAGFFVLRTPLLPVDELIGWSSGLTVRRVWEEGATPPVVERAWHEDVEALRKRLREVTDRPEILHALFVASPSLETGLAEWKTNPDSKKGVQAERALVRYFERMSARPTPFGLFSGCSTGNTWKESDNREVGIRLQPRSTYRSHTRLDFDYLFALTTSLRENTSIGTRFLYWPNSSLHRNGNDWHYVESRQSASGRTHHVVRLYGDQYLTSVLERARTGATVSDLVKALLLLSDANAVSEEEAKEYVQQLVANDILISSLSPLVTALDPLDDIVSQLDPLPEAAEITHTLKWARDRMKALDKHGVGANPGEYRAITERLESLPATLDHARLYQIDMTKPLEENLLPAIALQEICKGVEILSLVGPAVEPRELQTFRESFTAKYEQAWVPILEALDADIGIGFGISLGGDGSPLLKGLNLAVSSPPNRGEMLDIHRVLLRKLIECTHEGKSELELSMSDVPRQASGNLRFPVSFSVTAVVAARSQHEVLNGNFKILLKGLEGPSGARLLGRFCCADPNLETRVRDYLKAEESDDAGSIYAEIVYLPEGRIGNVLCRPLLRDYEISYLGRSGAPFDRQLPANDLLVSVRNNTIVLFSQKLNRPIVPRMTTAHNFSDPRLAPVYRFLCYLQHQNGNGGARFGWGPFGSLKFLPRVTIGRVVLSVAQWRLEEEELKNLVGKSRQESFIRIQELRQRRSLPRFVGFSEADNMLPVDLDNPLSVDAFAHVLKRSKQALLVEQYPPFEDSYVEGPEGRFQHEFVIPLMRRTTSLATKGRLVVEEKDQLKTLRPLLVDRSMRTKFHGSEWLYLKVYADAATLDDVLTCFLPPVLKMSFELNLVKRWFFVRFSDPHHHLRIRFNGYVEGFGRELTSLLSELDEWARQGKIWKLQFDTYDRELERYGGPSGMDVSEDIFFADSEAVLEILCALQGDEGLDMRWRVSLLGLDRLLVDCHLDLHERLNVIEDVRTAYYKEFLDPIHLRHQLGERFRKERHNLEKLLAQGNAHEVADAAFTRRSVRIAAALSKLERANPAEDFKLLLHTLVPSYLHMHINRFARSLPRAHELVLYDILFRIYDGRHSRQTGGRIG